MCKVSLLMESLILVILFIAHIFLVSGRKKKQLETVPFGFINHI